MSPDLRADIACDLEEMKLLFASLAELRSQTGESAPNRAEVVALGAYLHSFYSGVEKIFKKIIQETNETLSRKDGWHIALLDDMTRPHANRPAVISPELYVELRKYLAFRHVFRNSYTYRLEWTMMKSLVEESDSAFQWFEREITVFLNRTS